MELPVSVVYREIVASNDDGAYLVEKIAMKITKPLVSCFTYTIGKNLYIPITSRSNAKTLPETRGQNFLLGPGVVAALCRFRDEELGITQWEPWCMYLDTQMTPQKLPPALELVSELPTVEGSRLPSVGNLVGQISEACEHRSDFESIVIAGEGEPTLRLDDLVQLATDLKSSQENTFPPVRLTTNGLVEGPELVVQKLKVAGVCSLSVALMTADRNQYNNLMTPQITNGHGKVCDFIEAAIAAGLEVEVTAVDRPDVDKEMVQDLARDLNVPGSVRWRPFFS